MILRNLISIGFIVQFILLYGQGEFNHLTIQEGLSSNRTYQAVQDKDGFIWICTDEGVDRFDGKNLIHYPLEMHDEFASMGYQFTRIVIDQHDEIFVITNRSFVFRLNKLADKFERIKVFEKYYGRYVNAVFLDRNSNLFLGSPSGFLVYNYRNRLVNELKDSNLENVFSVTDFNDDYIICANGKLVKLSKDFSKTEVLGTWSLKQDEMQFHNLLYDKKKQRIWIGTKKNGLLYFDLIQNEFFKSKFNKYLNEFPIWDIKLINDSILLIGTDGAGLFKFDTNNKKILNQYVYYQDDDKTLRSNVVHGILVCKNLLYFITTDIGGVNILNPYKQDFFNIKREKGNKNSLGNNVIHAIKEIKPGVIAFGTDRGISLWNRNTGVWTHLENDMRGGKNNVVTAIANAPDGTFWVSFFIRKIKAYNASLKYKNVPEEIAVCKNPKAMLFDSKENTLWTVKSGKKIKLISYDFDTHAVNRFVLPEINALVASKKYIFAGSVAGLFIIDKQTNDYTRFLKLKGKLNRITSLAVVNDSIIMLGSDGGGLAKINLNNKSITVYSTDKGLASKHIFTIEVDNYGNVWAVTNEGLSKVNISSGKIVNYFVSDGISSGDFKYNASCKTSAGEIIIGGTNGATLFEPENVKVPITSSNLLFTNFYVNQKRIIAQKSDILETVLNDTQTILLKHNQNSFSLEFTCIDYIHPEQVKYIWKLEGVDKSWSLPSSVGKAAYSNLLPGDYVFRARLISRTLPDTQFLEKKFFIKIKPPVWKTPLAFVFYILIILLFIFLALHYNKLMHDVGSTKEKLRYLANMAHEIKTPLSLIRAPIGDVMRQADDKGVQEKLSLAIHNIEKLQKRISTFLDFKRIDKIANINLERIDIIVFVKRKIFAFKILAKRNKLNLTFESAAEKFDVYCDADLLDRIISNLLSNAIKYNKQGGFVNVRVQIDEPNWTLSVTDSGIGIPRKEQKKVFNPFYRASNAAQKSGSGVGLALVYDMVSVLNGTIELKSKENRGSTFTITFLIGKPDVYDVKYELNEENTEIQENQDDVKTNKIKVLIVEDDAELRNYMKKEFEKNFTIIEAVDGQNALSKVLKELPDLVLSDVAMSKMNGRQLCMNIKSQASISHIPVILLSGLDSKEHILKGLEAGADDYVTKPFDSSILMKKIENLINNRKKVRDKLLNPEKGDPQADIKTDYDKEFVKKITAVVAENISDAELSVRTLYTHVGMSRTAFYHKLKSLIDLSPAEFIRLIRLNKAKDLLQKRKYNVNEVAYMCGFSDAKYFSTSFKKQFGKSPSAFLHNS